VRWFVSRGWHGWVLLLALVAAFDVAAAHWGGESMTDAARRWFNHSIGRWFVVVLIVYVAIHLTVLPYRFDPLDRSYEWLQRKLGPQIDYDNNDYDYGNVERDIDAQPEDAPAPLEAVRGGKG
jgi:hypothetical protein